MDWNVVRRVCCGLTIADGMAPMASRFRNCRTVPREDPGADGHSALVIRHVNVQGHRTTVRLEPQIWESMTEICRREFCTPHDVCSYVAERRWSHGSLTSAVRVFIHDYFRTSATEDGHRTAGHGQGMFLSQQRGRLEMRASEAGSREAGDGRVARATRAQTKRITP